MSFAKEQEEETVDVPGVAYDDVLQRDIDILNRGGESHEIHDKFDAESTTDVEIGWVISGSVGDSGRGTARDPRVEDEVKSRLLE